MRNIFKRPNQSNKEKGNFIQKKSKTNDGPSQDRMDTERICFTCFLIKFSFSCQKINMQYSPARTILHTKCFASGAWRMQ